MLTEGTVRGYGLMSSDFTNDLLIVKPLALVAVLG